MMEVNFKINIKPRIRRIICFTLIIFFAFLVRMERAQVYAVQNPGAGSQMAGTDNPGTTALPAAQQPIITQLTSTGRTVKLTVNLMKDSQVSSGRIKIHYPQEYLSLADAQTGKLWQLEDVNKQLLEEGQNVVAFAWAGTEKFAGEGNLLTVTWEALDAASGKEITVETEIVELYSQKERLEVKSDWIIDRIRPSFPISTGNSASAVRTGDNSNAAALGILCLGSALLMARMIRKKLWY